MAAFRSFFQAAFKSSTGKMKTTAGAMHHEMTQAESRSSNLFEQEARDYAKKKIINNNLTEEEAQLYAMNLTTIVGIYVERNEFLHSSISKLEDPERLVRLKALLSHIKADSQVFANQEEEA